MLHRARSFLFFAAIFSLCAAPSAVRAQDQEYVLRPGDKVTITVFTAGGEQVSVVSGERILDRVGDMFLPYVGTIHAAGLDQTTLRELLVSRFETFYSQPVVNVKVELRVNVTGTVGRAGQYYMDPTATIIDVLSAAGGPGSEVSNTGYGVASDPGHVRLVRDGQTYVFSIRPDEVTAETLLLRVRSGDWIHVPARTRSRVRDEITFWGSVLSLVTGAVSLAILINRP